MVQSKKRTKTVRPKWSMVFTLAATFATGLVLYVLLIISQDVRRYDLLGSLGVLPIIALILSIAALILSSKNRKIELINTALIAIVATSVTVWLFGLTSAGSGLNTNYTGSDVDVCTGLSTSPDCYEE